MFTVFQSNYSNEIIIGCSQGSQGQFLTILEVIKISNQLQKEKQLASKFKVPRKNSANKFACRCRRQNFGTIGQKINNRFALASSTICNYPKSGVPSFEIVSLPYFLSIRRFRRFKNPFATAIDLFKLGFRHIRSILLVQRKYLIKQDESSFYKR